MPADAALRASCWVVALGYEEDTPRVTIHRYAHDTPAQMAGQRLVYQGYRSRVEGATGLGRNAVFKGFLRCRKHVLVDTTRLPYILHPCDCCNVCCDSAVGWIIGTAASSSS